VSELEDLRARVEALERALLAGGAERRLTLIQAYHQGVLPRKPATVHRWLSDPERRRRFLVEVLVERVGGRLYTSPSRVDAWARALADQVRAMSNRRTA
jgi:hypothetical protein